MSFRIALQRNHSPSNFVNKQLVDVAYATGVLKQSASIIDPVILIESNLTESIVAQINYCTIEEFSRKYYITNIKAMNNKIWEIHCHVDVLMTYADKIKEQNAIVARQSNKFNMYLDDGWFMSYQNPIIQTKVFSIAAPFERQEFVLVVAGN